MSATAVIWPIISAVCKAALFVGADATSWQPVDKQQEFFLSKYVARHDELKGFSDKELQAWASRDHKELNTILKNEGFDITLNPFNGGFGVVSILDVLVKWLHEGKKVEWSRNGVKYPFVCFEKGVSQYKSGEYTVIKIETKSSDTVWMTIAGEPLEGFELIDHIKSIRAQLVPIKSESELTVWFPMVDLDQQVDISWLLGMKLVPGYSISQAKQQTKLKMNEKGAHVRSGVAIGLERCCLPRPISLVRINEPFYMWIERPGLSHPLFAGYITEEHWKEPKDLEGK